MLYLLCVVLFKGSNGFPRGTSCMRVGGKVVLCVVFIVCCVMLCVGLSKGSNGFPRGTSCLNVGGSTANSDSQT